MALDFQQIQEQVRQIGEGAQAREQELNFRREKARRVMEKWNNEIEGLRQRVEKATHDDAVLRCAKPPDPRITNPEPLLASFSPGLLPRQATILAADGSQILPDRHAEVLYCLINVGAIQMVLGSHEPPQIFMTCKFLSEEDLFTSYGMISEAMLSLTRDRYERAVLADLAKIAPPPVITFTDGPIELWSSRGSQEEAEVFQRNLREYLSALESLCHQQVIVSGYVDKPFSNLVVRLLEIADAGPDGLDSLRTFRPFRGVTDKDLYHSLLNPGDRSPVFAIQSISERHYQDDLALHFFYLNVGKKDHPWLARVEVPAWVVKDSNKLDILHAVLVDQCRMMGSRYFPYLLHRAHETAAVSFSEKDQVTQMLALELHRRGVSVGEASQKQELKETEGRTRFSI